MQKYILGFCLDKKDYEKVRRFSKEEGGKKIPREYYHFIPNYLTKKKSSEEQVLVVKAFNSPKNLENFMRRLEEEHIQLFDFSMCSNKKRKKPNNSPF